MRIIGDVHGKIRQYIQLALGHVSVQVGDLGCGFVPVATPENGYFIRGNHDDPEVAKNHPAYLGDFGVQQLDNLEFFFLSGAWSIDRRYRTEGYDWWKDEELSIVELNEAIDLYSKTKPRIVITHDCPVQMAKTLVSSVAIWDIDAEKMIVKDAHVFPTRTGQALTSMFEIHQPRLWVFGHYHKSATRQIGNTRFVCLNELEVLDI